MELSIARVLTSTALILAWTTSWIHRKLCYMAPILFLTVVSMHLVQAQIVFTIPSEFLGEYPPLESIDQVPNSYFWRAPDAEKKYRALLIEQPEIFLAPDSEYKGIKPDAFKIISDTLRDFIATAAAENHPVVEQPGPGVVRVRSALMDLYFKKGSEVSWFRNVGGIVDYEMRAAIGRNISLVEARLEIEATNSETGKRLAVVVAHTGQKKMDELDLPERPSSWSDLFRTLDRLSDSTRVRITDLFVDEPADP
ncbi:MAG: DUF3313 family protein [Acidobacteria bacterium]|nr:DUF3313 family protein [Acidobacteriota bacterium]